MTAFLFDEYALLLALVFGLTLFFKISAAYKWVCLLLLVYFLTELCGYLIRIQNIQGRDNTWLYNLSYILYFLLYLIIYSRLSKEGYKKQVLLFTVYLVSWVISYYSVGINVFFKIPVIIMSCSLVFLYCMLLFKETMNYRGRIWSSPVFYLSAGIVINYGCLIPFFALLSLLSRAFPPKSLNLIFTMTGFFNDALYFSFLVSFFLNYRQNLKKI